MFSLNTKRKAKPSNFKMLLQVPCKCSKYLSWSRKKGGKKGRN